MGNTLGSRTPFARKCASCLTGKTPAQGQNISCKKYNPNVKSGCSQLRLKIDKVIFKSSMRLAQRHQRKRAHEIFLQDKQNLQPHQKQHSKSQDKHDDIDET